ATQPRIDEVGRELSGRKHTAPLCGQSNNVSRPTAIDLGKRIEDGRDQNRTACVRFGDRPQRRRVRLRSQRVAQRTSATGGPAKLLSQESKTGDPVVILDDVFAELDAGRRDRLASLVADNEQVIITAAVAEDVPSSLKATVFKVSNGEVERV
ncbi:MAG: hypothetical protein RL545_611, partial [Actinomycetota bacterium]